MARPASKKAEAVETQVLTDAAASAVNDIAEIQQQATENTKALALTLHYTGSLLPDALEDGVRDNQRVIGSQLFQMGARLALLKEQLPHGEFGEALERLDIHERLAQRSIQVALKFSNASTSTHLDKLGKSKIFELLVLDDEEVDQLNSGDSVRGLTFDDIDRMSIKDLRKQLREGKEQLAAKDRLIQDKNKKIDELHTQTDTVANAELDEVLLKLTSDATVLAHELTASINAGMRRLLTDITDHHVLHGGDSDHVLNGLLGQINNALSSLRADFINDIPEWQRWNDEQGDAGNQLDLVDEAE